MKKILITGADGFIGGYLLELLDKLENIDYKCICIAENNKVKQENQIIANILDAELVHKIVSEYQPDVILHMAAIANVVVDDLHKLYEINVIGTENILRAASSISSKKIRFIMMSSAGVYGNQEPMYYNENLPYNPANHYSYTKMIDEFLCKQYENQIEIIRVRPFTVIGKNQTQGFFVAKLVDAYKKKLNKIEVGNIDSIRDYVDVKYCASVLKELIMRDNIPFSVINICGGRTITGKEVISTLNNLTGHYPEIVINDKFVRKNEVWHLVGDPTRVHEFMRETEQQRSFEEMIKEMLY